MKRVLPILALGVLAAGPAMAHPLLTGADFAGGFSHPFMGWDHVLAMTALGLWVQVSKANPITAIVTFLAAMAAGFVLGANGVHVPLVEPGILASVLVFGLLAAMAVKLPAAVAAPVIAAFAVFHGHAHGTEAPLGASLLYAGGFILASAGIISASYMTTRLIKNETVARRIGIAIVAAGAVLGFAA
jgi:urease accessory protein